jgi:hypothetical protein
VVTVELSQRIFGATDGTFGIWIAENSGSISAVGTAITALVAIVAAVGAIFQLGHLRNAHFHELRAFCSVRYEVHKDARGDDCIWLVISNFGKTPAYDVTLNFNLPHWNYSSASAKYPFLAENGGISVLAPGETRRYFAARLSAKDKLSAADANSLIVIVNFFALNTLKNTKRLLSETQRLSMQDFSSSKTLLAKSKTTGSVGQFKNRDE